MTSSLPLIILQQHTALTLTVHGVLICGMESLSQVLKQSSNMYGRSGAGQSGASDANYPANVWKTGQTTDYYSSDDGKLQKGVAWPDPKFTDNGNRTVTDNLTGLTWLKDTNCFSSMAWQNALTTAGII